MREEFTYTHKDYQKYKTSHTWFYFKKWGFSLLAPPKCGSSSIKQFIWMNELEDSVMLIKQHQSTGEIYVVVRNPIDRFASLWRSKCRDKNNLAHKEVHGMSPVELMDYIESGAKDVHWTQQTEMIRGLTPTLIPMEYLSVWWKQRGFGELGKFNATVGDVDIDDELLCRIASYYSEDCELYTKALYSF